jgi:hypothetical protein
MSEQYKGETQKMKKYLSGLLKPLMIATLILFVAGNFLFAARNAEAGWGDPRVTVDVTPEGSGTVTLNGTLYASPRGVPDNSLALFEAIPSDGYEFVSWNIVDTTGSYSRSTNPTQYLITCDTTVTANFREVNDPPVANAGEDQTVDEGSTVILDGSASYDPEGPIASYLWTQTGGTSVTLSDTSAIQPTFTVPDVDEDGESLSFQLTVTDNGGLQSTDTCIVNVTHVEEDGSSGDDNDGGDGDGGGCFIATAACEYSLGVTFWDQRQGLSALSSLFEMAAIFCVWLFRTPNFDFCFDWEKASVFIFLDLKSFLLLN